MIVVDASVVVSALLDDGEAGRKVRSRLVNEQLAAPELVDVEVMSVLRRQCSANVVSTVRATQAVADLAALRLDRFPHQPLMSRCWELRGNVSVYDATYVALAELLNATLVTADQRLANAPGSTCVFEVLT